MIGQLRGTILEKNPPYLLLEINGVGYEIIAPLLTFQHLPGADREVVLYTHLIVREDTYILYGFHNEENRLLFRRLIKINGIGPKLALTILSRMNSDEFVRCIIDQSIQQLTSIPGISRKIAERLFIETKSALKIWKLNTSSEENGISIAQVFQNSIQDAISALVSLGYKPKESKRLIESIQRPGLTREDLIRRALKKHRVIEDTTTTIPEQNL
ncbi:Holliday junction branch migration protein RuvA [Coxiella endosymbiont of Amblyomma sculptum]|uniref:Holliday junction branch migration protein RuvA n=1 Tax=Coxiella endosymbiont of Amblyomma sculptum TaxID=2487929 RepID=UPI00132EA43F|nr:Holliday junction branch migration protein RuvA [Coxiella endosymbiont of Amblyomma sculptum]QHG92278.1 Holliday junction branch migration protein RuvA [Coxiella endosymbiont of Amblyomma sculptum]